MKTTVEIFDALLDDARKVADRRGVTLRALIEEGLRHVPARDALGSRLRAALVVIPDNEPE